MDKQKPMIKLLIYIFTFALLNSVFAQTSKELILVTNNGVKKIPAYEREKTFYFSIQHFAEEASINYFFNAKTGKIELKFEKYLIKATPKNPYLIITPRSSGIPYVYQLPTSSNIKDEKIYMPLFSSLSPIEAAYGKEIKFEKPNKLVVSNSPSLPPESQNWFYDESELAPSGYGIIGLTVNEKANGTLIRIHSKKRIPSYYSSYKDGILTIIFRKVNADIEKANIDNVSGLIEKIATRNVGPDTEFKFMVGEEYSTNEVINASESNDILITVHNKIFTKDRNTEKHIQKWDFDAIVIDAGHGGKDPGAIGVDNLKEKDVTLGIALNLGKLIEKELPDVKVIFTRKDDSFVDLYKRGKIANENEGSIFISIHCNSTKKKPTDVNGSEVYLLRPGRTEEAIEIAEFENSVIEYEEDPGRYDQLTDENFILVSMAHSSYMKYSEKFAELLHKEFRTNSKLESRGVKQAGFYVLVGASMPSVLIETGFISNKKDAALLKTKAGQQQMAELIFGAIKTYREYYEKEMQAEL